MQMRSNLDRGSNDQPTERTGSSPVNQEDFNRQVCKALCIIKIDFVLSNVLFYLPNIDFMHVFNSGGAEG